MPFFSHSPLTKFVLPRRKGPKLSLPSLPNHFSTRFSSTDVVTPIYSFTMVLAFFTSPEGVEQTLLPKQGMAG